jgi:hypothetical protein
MKQLSLTILIYASLTAMAFGQSNTKTESVLELQEQQDINRKHFVGSSLFMLYNFFPDSADFYQLSYGYHLTQKDIFVVEAITWKYNEPLGTYGSSEELYPGKIRSYGIGAAYQRFLWMNLYSTIEATPFLQQYYDTDNKKIQKGFQLYLQLVLGYRFEFLKKRLFAEPAIALKYWPVNTNVPSSFSDIDSGTPQTKVEPSLNFGYKF